MSNIFRNPDNLVDIVRQVLSGKPIEEKEQKVAAYDKKGKQVGLYKNMADAKRLKPGHTYKPHKEELDPVNKKAVKKKFDDRKDKDIDNDGDVDSTDKYLHKRRKAISKSLNEKEPKKKINASHCEEVEIDEAKYEYDEKEGVAKISKKDFAKLPKDYKGSDPKKPTMLMLTKKGTSLVPVKFTEEVELGEGKLTVFDSEEKARAYAKKNGGKVIRGTGKAIGSWAVKEEVELDENYRKAALKGIGAETANSIKVGTGVDYYSPKDGSKHMGKITRMDKNGYEVKDDKTGRTFKFKYYSKDAMKEEKRNCGCEQDPCITYGDQTVKEAADEDSDGEKKTAAQKADMDGDGEKDTGEKKKKKKDEKGEKEDEAKPDKVDTEPEMNNVKTMMSEREMTDKEKAKLDKLKKKYEGGEMHKSMKDQYGDKADEVFYGKLTKMAMGEEIDFNESKYNKDAVDKAIKRDPRIKGKEAKKIHRLLKGRTGKKEDIDFNDDAEYLEEKQIDALKKKAEKTGISYSILKQVYNRGMAAWRTGHRPGTTPQQWAFARVNSFATKSKGTWGGADKDLAAKARGSMKEEIESLEEAEGSVKVKAGPAHDRKVKSITGLAQKMGLKVTRKGKSDDGKMTTIHLSGNQKKIIDIQALGSRLDESFKLNEDKKELTKISKELEGASKMHKGQSDRIKKMLDKGDMKEAKDGEEKDTNLIMQLRKAVSLRGHTVNFTNGPEKVPANVANAFLMKYAKLKRPAEKDMMTKSGGKSLNHLKLAIKGKFEKPSNPLDLPKMKSEK